MHAKNLKGKLLLAHGTMDTNVPFYSTLLVVDELIKANKDFDLIMFPNRGHGFGSEPYMVRRRWDYFVRASARRRAAGRIRNASAVGAGDATDGATPLGDGSRHAAHRHVARDFSPATEIVASAIPSQKLRRVARRIVFAFLRALFLLDDEETMSSG